MKIYSAENMFPVRDFPLHVTMAEQRAFMPPHRHDYIELALVARGHTIHHIWNEAGEELSYGLIQGDLFAVMPGEVHAYSENNRLELYNIAFQPKVIERDWDELSTLRVHGILFVPGSGHFRNRIHLSPLVRREAERCLKNIIMADPRKEGYRLKQRIAFLEFLTTINDSAVLGFYELSRSTRLGLLKVLDLMENDPKNDMELDAFAKLAGMSTSLFTRKFRELTGDSPMNYRLGLRLDIARRMLMDTSLSIGDIAFRCGFYDSNYMIKRFRNRNGVTPGRYRKMMLTGQ